VSDHLGRFLLSAGLIDRTALTRALDAQHRRRCPLVAALVTERLLDEEDLYQLHLYRARFEPAPEHLVTAVSVQALSLLPASIAERFWVVPVRVSFEGSGARLLYLATTDPEDTHSLVELGAFTESKIIPLVARFSAISEALAQWYGVELAPAGGVVAMTIDPDAPSSPADTGEEVGAFDADAPGRGDLRYSASTLSDSKELERARLVLFGGGAVIADADDAEANRVTGTYSDTTDPGARESGDAGAPTAAGPAGSAAAAAGAGAGASPAGAASARGAGAPGGVAPAGAGARAAAAERAFSGVARPQLRVSSVDGTLDLDRAEPQPVPAHVAAWAGFAPGAQGGRAAPEPEDGVLERGRSLSGAFPLVPRGALAGREAVVDTFDDAEVELQDSDVSDVDSADLGDPALAAATAAPVAAAPRPPAVAKSGPLRAGPGALLANAVANASAVTVKIPKQALAAAAAPKPVLTAAQVAERVRAAPDRDAAVAAALEALSGRFPRVMLFLVKPDAVQGFDGRGISVEQIKGIRIPLEIPSMFKDVRDSKNPYLGRPGKSAAHTVFTAALSGALGEAFIMPVIARGKVSLMVYADACGKPTLDLAHHEIGDWCEVARALGEVVDRLLAAAGGAH